MLRCKYGDKRMQFVIAICLLVVSSINHYFVSMGIQAIEVFYLLFELLLLTLVMRFINDRWSYLLVFILLISASFEAILLLPLLTLLFLGYSLTISIMIGLAIGAIAIYLQASTLVMIIPFCIAFTEIYSRYLRTKEKLTSQLDQERALRYDLEYARNELMRTQQEIIYLTEVHERNRIARDIHDKVGHQLTGTLLALEASMMTNDSLVRKSFLQKSHRQLSEGIDTIRKTVHDISTVDRVGISSFIEIIEAFEFCPVQYHYTGDVNNIPTHVYVVLIMNFREALTNIVKYSKASHVTVSLDSQDEYIRLSVSDNGKGCLSVKEGLGLDNMRQRLLGINGILSYHSDSGFEVVMFVKRGSNENFDSR